MIVEQANEMFTEAVVNGQGQIVDLERFNEALVAIMEDRYTGGMEKLSKTVRGSWSTVTGITKSALATLAGVATDGSVRTGSALDLLKNAVQSVSGTLERWQADGTLDAIAQKFDKGLATAVNLATGAINFFRQEAYILVPAITAIGTVLGSLMMVNAVAGAFTALSGAVAAVSAAGGVLNAVLLASPLLPVAVAVAALIGAVVLLRKNWESITTFFTTSIDKIKNKFDSLVNKIKNSKIAQMVGSAYTAANNLGLGTIPTHATGTSYFAGGMTRINEGGRGEVVNLPNGTQIIPHDQRPQQAAPQVNVQVTVQGNIIGNQQYADYLGNQIWNRVAVALGNM